jgi:hypothetical protein
MSGRYCASWQEPGLVGSCSIYIRVGLGGDGPHDSLGLLARLLQGFGLGRSMTEELRGPA